MIVTNVAKLVVVNPESKQLLLIRRSQTDDRRPGQWDIPGGGVEDSESLEAAVIRECQEEVGISFTADEVKLIFTISEVIPDQDRLGNWLFFYGITNQIKPVLSFEHDDFRWMSLEEAMIAVSYERHKRLLLALYKHKLIAEL